MTSGNFHSVEVSKITVNREERQRRGIDNIEVLADSIGRLGLIQPIVLSRDLVLIAGERRLQAIRTLGHTHIACQFVDELDPRILRAIELEENIKRSALIWQDECRAVNEYHLLRKGEAPTWTHEDTGKALGLSQSTVTERITVAESLDTDERVAAAPKFSTARGIVNRTAARRDEESLLELRKVAGVPPTEAEPDSILTADFNEWAKTYTGPKFNFIHCDFPYGIGADKFNQGAALTHGGYDDTEDSYWTLLRNLLGSLDRLATESAHIMFWFSMHFYQPTLDFFHSNSDFVLDPFPLLWVKSDNVGILPDPERGPRRIYETALFGSRGDRKIVRPTSNAVHLPTDRNSHMSTKPQPVLQSFFRMFVDSSTLILDPTCGSGSALRAAEALGAKYILGLERDPDFAERARLALKSSRQKGKTNAKANQETTRGEEVVGEAEEVKAASTP